MAKESKPQIYPTDLLRSFVVSSLKLIDKVPFAREILARDYQGEASDIPLTILLPLHGKDLWIAKYAVAFARRNVKHPIHEVVVVSPRDESIQEWTTAEGLRWVCENEVFDWTIAGIREKLPEHAKDRDRWIYQQLLKLSADNYIETEALLVLDADTLLLKPKVFKKDDELWLDYSHERNLLYLEAYRQLLGRKQHSFTSYVTHHMFMELSVLKRLQEEIASESKENWDEAIVKLASSEIWSEKQIQVRPFNYFSEYETYGNFVREIYPKVHSHYFRNYSARGFDPESLDVLSCVEKLPKFYQWASFHSYNKHR